MSGNSQKSAGGGSGRLSDQEAYQLGMSRESWCAVEMKKEQDWCRATRKHYTQQFSSSVFSAPPPEEEPPRCTWKVDEPKHKERRHFSDRYACKWKV